MTAAITEIPSRLRNVSSNDPYVAGADDIDFNKPATTGTTGAYPYNGMGRVVIPKKIVNSVNTLTHEAFEDSEGNDRENTIYVIQYDFTLGEDITIPANCVLEFDGGSISNGTINGEFGIDAPSVKILNNVSIPDYKKDFKFSWIVGTRTTLTNSDFQKLPNSEIDFENIEYTASETITLHHLKDITFKNLNIILDGSLIKYVPAPSESNQGNCVRKIDSAGNYYIETSINLPQDYVGYIISIRTADSVKVDPRIESTDIRKGVASMIYKIDGNKVYILDYIENFSASVDRDGTTIYSTFNIYYPYKFNLYDCNFYIMDNQSAVSITANNSNIVNCKFDTDKGTEAVFLLGGYNTKASRCIIGNACKISGTGTNYGIQVNNSSRIVIEDCEFYNNRRAVDFSGNLESRYCEVRNCYVSNIFKSEAGSALGSHSGSYGNVFRNNVIFGSYQAGIQFRGEKEKAIGNRFYSTTTGGVFVVSVDSEIIDNVVYEDSGVFVNCGNLDVDSNIIIKGNEVKQYGTFIYIDNPKAKFNVIGNNITFTGGDRLLFNKGFKGVLKDNILNNISSAALYVDKTSTLEMYSTILSGIRVPVELVGWDSELPSEEQAKITYNWRMLYFDMNTAQDYGNGTFNGSIRLVMDFSLSSDLTVPVKIAAINQKIEFSQGFRTLVNPYELHYVTKPADTNDLIFAAWYLGLETYSGLLKAGSYHFEVEL